MFVFRNDDPSSLWYFLLFGPMSTLPAVVTSCFWPRIGGPYFIMAAIVSSVFAIAAVPQAADVLQMIIYYSMPMLLLGIGVLVLAVYGRQPATLNEAVGKLD